MDMDVSIAYQLVETGGAELCAIGNHEVGTYSPSRNATLLLHIY